MLAMTLPPSLAADDDMPCTAVALNHEALGSQNWRDAIDPVTKGLTPGSSTYGVSECTMERSSLIGHVTPHHLLSPIRSLRQSSRRKEHSEKRFTPGVV